MKKTISIISFLFILYACGKEDNSSTSGDNADRFVGNWSVTDTTGELSLNGSGGYDTSYTYSTKDISFIKKDANTVTLYNFFSGTDTANGNVTSTSISLVNFPSVYSNVSINVISNTEFSYKYNVHTNVFYSFGVAKKK